MNTSHSRPSWIRKAWIGGALYGGATLVIHVLGLMMLGGEKTGWMFLGPYLVITTPTYWLLDMFAITKPGSFVEIPPRIFALMIVVNTLICAVLSIVICALWSKMRPLFSEQ